jgi:hypothetical protein
MPLAVAHSLAMKESTATSQLGLAAKSGMLVKLHINDGCGIATDIPIKNLLKVNSNEEAITVTTASYSTLRHCALSSLFRYSPKQQVPNYAFRNFETIVSYQDETQGCKVIVKNDADLTAILEQSATNNLLDDNDNVILNLHCQFRNNYHESDQVKHIRASATAAADNVVLTLKKWLDSAQNFVQEKTKEFMSGRDDHNQFVFVSDGKPKQNTSPVEWIDRFVTFLLYPEELGKQQQRKSPPIGATSSTKEAHKSEPSKISVVKSTVQAKEEALLDIMEEISCSFADGVIVLSDKISKSITRTLSRLLEPLSSSENDAISPSSSVSSISNNTSVPSIQDVVEKDEGVEIVYDKEDKNAPEEWKIFFDADANEGNDDEESDGNLSFTEEMVLVVDCPEEVLSLASSNISCDVSSDSTSFSNISREASKKSGDDDASWAMLEDDE